MKLKILGSAGALPFPKPGCTCKDCLKARKLGIPYERISPSLFVNPDILIDTPESVYQRLTQFNINTIRHVFYTHWHHDHTQGFRLLEMLCKSGFAGKSNNPPINVYLPTDTKPEMKKYVESLFYYEKRGFVKIIEVQDRQPVKLNNISIAPVNLKRDDRIRYAFLIEQQGKKAMYAPCSIYKTKFDKFWENLDLLMIEAGWKGPTKEIRDAKKLDYVHDHQSMEESFEIIQKLKPKRTILTHLCGAEHHTYDYVKSQTDKHENVDTAYDGMDIEV
ncbi:MBL fold metallo-hydrolase [Candidatus Woesearchaeota archaeon]|nr:MBL fold metallo-hydrolase [Candidatus Woesearchaeota archaeon]